MTEFNTRISKGEYEIIFKTNIWSEYKEIQEAMRSIIDSHKTKPVRSNTNTHIGTMKEILHKGVVSIMKVKELIEQLQRFDEDTEVSVININRNNAILENLDTYTLTDDMADTTFVMYYPKNVMLFNEM